VPQSGISYTYKASLIGVAQQFELTDDGLSWRIGEKKSVWPYSSIAAIGLSYRPVSMQSRRFRADIANRSGERLAILSTTWQTIALMTPQDESYRLFITALHRRLAQHGSNVALSGGMRPLPYALSAGVLAIVALAIAGLLVRAITTGATAGALFLVACAALFGWQIGGFMWRNKPGVYTLDALPKDLLP
jgi:hypothetical protein